MLSIISDNYTLIAHYYRVRIKKLPHIIAEIWLFWETLKLPTPVVFFDVPIK